MSSSPVTLDFSKAQPISQDQSSGVQLDFSKAQPISTDQALGQAAATVAKPEGIDPVDRMRDVPGHVISALTPDEMPKPNKDFGVHMDMDTGRINYTYPAGQKPLDPAHPDLSEDDQGNVYWQGNKLDAKSGIVFPTPGVGLPTTGAMAEGAKTAAQAVKTFLQSEAAKEGAKFLAKHAITGAAKTLGTATIGAGLYKLGKMLGYF